MSTIRRGASPTAHTEVGPGLQAGLDASAPIDTGLENERTPLLEQDNEESLPEHDHRADPSNDDPVGQGGFWQTWRRPSVSLHQQWTMVVPATSDT